MQRKRWICAALVAAGLLLAGCTNYGDYYKGVDAANARQVELERARAEAEAIRYQALMRIAESGDPTAKVAAVMALAGLGQGAAQAARTAVPAQPQNEALQWAGILSAPVTQLGTTWLTGRVQMHSSDNATRLGLSTNEAFRHFASQIPRDPLVIQPEPPLIVPVPEPYPVPTPPVIVPVPEPYPVPVIGP